MLWSLAWRNLWRRRFRTWLTLTSLGFAATLLVFTASLQFGVYETMKENTLRIFDGFAQLQPHEYLDDPDVTRLISDGEALSDRITAELGIPAAPRGTSFVILANGDRSYGSAIVGVDPVAEKAVTSLHAAVSRGRGLEAGDEDAILLGSALARNLGLELGDSVTILGSAADRTVAADSLELVGIFETGLGDFDRQMAQMPLDRFQETFALGSASNTIILAAASVADVMAAVPDLERIAKELDVSLRDWGDLQPSLEESIVLDAATSAALYLALVLVVAFILLNTILMSVLERTREFGTLVAVGIKPVLLGKVMWLELSILTALGCVSGIIIGGGTALSFSYVGIDVPGMEGLLAQFGIPSRIYPEISALALFAGPGLICVAVLIGGFVPYRRILRLDALTAMTAV